MFGQRSVSMFEESDSSSTPVATPPERDDCGHTGSTASVGVTQRASRGVCECASVLRQVSMFDTTNFRKQEVNFSAMTTFFFI